MIEFTLVSVPMIFLMISTVEMARAMWCYHSLANAVRGTGRFAVVHGIDCTQGVNACAVTVSKVVSTFLLSGTGLPTNSTDLTLTLTSKSGSVTCNPVNSCLTNITVWPPTADAAAGSAITIAAKYRFRSSWFLMEPGSGGSALMSPTLSASTTQAVQF